MVRTILQYMKKKEYRLSESNHESNLVKLGSWIVTTHGREQTKRMLGSYEMRDKGATELLGLYYGPSVSPKFTKMVDALGSPTATEEARRSVIREALHAIELHGLSGVQIRAAKLEVAYAKAVAA